MLAIVSILAVISGLLVGVIISNIQNLDKMTKLRKRIEALEKISLVTDDTAHSASDAVGFIYELERAHWNWTRQWVNHLLVKSKLDDKVWVDPVEPKEDVEVSVFDIKEVSKDG